jgi:hypothetical protein
MRRFSSKLGRYCGDAVEISHPLLPIGMNTPISIGHLYARNMGIPEPRRQRRQRAKHSAKASGNEIASSVAIEWA